MKHSFLHLLAILAAGLILVALTLFGGPLKTASSYDPLPQTATTTIGKADDAQASSTPHVQKITDKKEDGLDLWLDQLIKLECRNCGPRFRRLDTNGKYSYGCLQFQAATFERYARRYGIIQAGDDFLADTIYDCGIQRQIARQMVADLGARAAAGNWFYSVYIRGLGLPII